jgi:hypothetical protein
MGAGLRLALTLLANADIKQRIEQRVARYGRAAGLAMAGFFVLLLVLAFLAQTLVAWLSLHVGPIWAPLIAAGVLLALCLILVLAAYLTIHEKPRPRAASSALAGASLPALPNLGPVLRNRMPEIVAAAVVTGLLLGRAKRR